MAIIKEDWSPEAREAAAKAKGSGNGTKPTQADIDASHERVIKAYQAHAKSANREVRGNEHPSDSDKRQSHIAKLQQKHQSEAERHKALVKRFNESTQPLLKALLEHDFKTAQKLFARLMAGRARKAMYELQIYTGRRLQESRAGYLIYRHKPNPGYLTATFNRNGASLSHNKMVRFNGIFNPRNWTDKESEAFWSVNERAAKNIMGELFSAQDIEKYGIRTQPHTQPLGESRQLQEGSWDANKNELKDRIKSTITQLKKEGTLRMAATNLKAVVSTRGLSFANPNAFERAFNDACEELKKASPAFGKFIMESVIQEEWSEEARKAAKEARKGEHPSYQRGHKDYTDNNRESPKNLDHQSRQRNSSFSKMYERHVGAIGTLPEKLEAGGHYRRGWNDAYESHVGDLKREMESAKEQKPAHTRSLDEDWSPEAREAAAKARGPHEGFHKVLTQHGYEHKGTTMFDRSKGPKTQAAHLYQHSTEHRPSIRTTSRAWHTGTSVKGTTPETLQAHLSQKHGDK